MKIPWIVVMIALVLVFGAGGASAQGTYVGASLVGDVLRVSHVESTGVDQSAGGEALGFALRLGSEIGPKWGVELEFARPSEIETEFNPRILAVPTVTTSVPPGSTVPSTTVFPPFSYRFSSHQRNTTLSAGLWARQQLSSGLSLVYLGGVSFLRRTEETSVEIVPGPFVMIFPVPPIITTATAYDTTPFVGVEGRVRMTPNLNLVPGVRLHGVEGGWLLRPSVGLSWAF